MHDGRPRDNVLRVIVRLAASRLLPDGAPTEFCIFEVGAFESSKGPYLFDAKAAKTVMADYATRGVDLMIDLNHDSLDLPMRSDSGDARGWFKLQLRDDGSLWAVDVRWTPDGARRLAEKTQRYISPAFTIAADDTDRRISELINVAICAMPATYDAAPLVAASRVLLASPETPASVPIVDPEQIKAAIDALTDGTIAKALGLDAAATPQDILDAVTATVAALGPAAGAPDSVADNAVPESPDAPVANQLKRDLKCATLAEAFAEIARLQKVDAGLVAERAALEGAQRVELVASLVKLNGETPATAWADPDQRIPCDRLAKESIDSLRTRVVALRALPARVAVTPPTVVTNVTGVEATITLTADEEKAAAKMTPEQRARFVALRAAHRAPVKD